MDRAHAAARHLAERGVHVVSGGALGIDGAAHRGALAGARASTTVVLGTGADVAYPARHAGLFDRILGSGGALASLLPDGTGPRPGTFPQRNPLIAALADVVVVVEAELRQRLAVDCACGARLRQTVVAYPGSRGLRPAARVGCGDRRWPRRRARRARGHTAHAARARSRAPTNPRGGRIRRPRRRRDRGRHRAPGARRATCSAVDREVLVSKDKAKAKPAKKPAKGKPAAKAAAKPAAAKVSRRRPGRRSRRSRRKPRSRRKRRRRSR